MHQSGILFVVERSAIYLKHTGRNTCLRCVRTKRFLAGGQGHGAPLVSSLQATALCSTNLAGAGCDHVDGLLQALLVASSKLPFVNAEGQITEEGGCALQTHLCGIEVNHQPVRIAPGRESCFQGGSLTAL